VVGCSSTEETIDVLFVAYGNTETVPRNTEVRNVLKKLRDGIISVTDGVTGVTNGVTGVTIASVDEKAEKREETGMTIDVSKGGSGESKQEQTGADKSRQEQAKADKIRQEKKRADKTAASATPLTLTDTSESMGDDIGVRLPNGEGRESEGKGEGSGDDGDGGEEGDEDEGEYDDEDEDDDEVVTRLNLDNADWQAELNTRQPQVTLLLHWCYTFATLWLRCCHTDVTMAIGKASCTPDSLRQIPSSQLNLFF
jgi:hypothetical protein